jgi:glyoxylase-like metal-dependent hydrolase (beta-lactamase superfamily II)
LKGIKEITKDTYIIFDDMAGFKVYSYLLVGEEKALLIDTGYGKRPFKDIVKGITDKPLIIVNTHGHLDHIAGNDQFESVYLHPADNDVYHLNTDKAYITDLIRKTLFALPRALRESGIINKLIDRYASHKRVEILPTPEVFELGNRPIKVIETPGHTVGSICLMDEKNKILFSGDTICDKMILLYFEYSAPVRVFYESVKKLQNLKNEGAFNIIYPAHHKYPLPPLYVDDYAVLCDAVLSGKGTSKPIKCGWPSYKTKYKTISLLHLKRDD